MSINSQLALLSFGNTYLPNLPMSPGTLGQDDLQQLLWGYPDILWGESVVVLPSCIIYVDLYNPTALAIGLRNAINASVALRNPDNCAIDLEICE